PLSAVARALVGPEAQEECPLPEAPALALLVADLDHELRPQRRLLESTRTPAVGLVEAPLGRALEQGQDLVERRVVPGSRHRAGPDVVELVLVVEAEQKGGEPRPFLLPAHAHDHAVRG